MFDNFLDIERLVVYHEWVLTHHHIFGQVEVLSALVWILLAGILACQEQKVMVKEDHAHDFYHGVIFERLYSPILIAGLILRLEQTNLL